MSNKVLYFLASLGLVIFSIITQSVLFPLFFKNDYMPDLTLIVIIYFSINYGKNIGQVLGFSSGIVLDSLSGAPFGLNTLVRLIIGFLLGFFKGKIFLDKILLPCIIITICTIFKFFLIQLVSMIFPIDFEINFFTIRFLIELGMNIVLTPIIFFLLNIMAKKLYVRRDN
ncbi:MAG: rod shape-determining protein MreD [Spirochaetales bacterium]|nr:rod shape-determining protein MreD [Spirochaetales bacterium]